MITVNLKERILIPLTFFLTLALAVLVVSLYVVQEEKTNTELTHTAQALEGYYQRALEENSQKLIAMLDLVTDESRIVIISARCAALGGNISEAVERIERRLEETSLTGTDRAAVF